MKLLHQKFRVQLKRRLWMLMMMMMLWNRSTTKNTLVYYFFFCFLCNEDWTLNGIISDDL